LQDSEYLCAVVSARAGSFNSQQTCSQHALRAGLSAPPRLPEPFAAAPSHSPGTRRAGDSASERIAARCWRSIRSCRVEVLSESSKKWVGS